MSFSCAKHGWSHTWNSCPICPKTVTFATNTAKIENIEAFTRPTSTLQTGIEERQLKIKELQKEVEALKVVADRYNVLIYQLRKLEREEQAYQSNALKTKLLADTQFTEPTYPSIGCCEENGFATFESEDQAKTLIDVLKSYYYGYVLKWSGRGRYLAIPSYRSDHDGDTVYTCTFEKERK